MGALIRPLVEIWGPQIVPTRVLVGDTLLWAHSFQVSLRLVQRPFSGQNSSSLASRLQWSDIPPELLDPRFVSLHGPPFKVIS